MNQLCLFLLFACGSALFATEKNDDASCILASATPPTTKESSWKIVID